ncbi:MAG: GNAT family N-acetyltransferase [Geminicoccaceae bacterium]
MELPLIRSATVDDAGAISHVIVRALRETNAGDYPPAVISALVQNFAPERILELLATRDVLVACLADEIVGTASLEHSAVRTVFVAPEHQGRGLGSALMRELEVLCRTRGLTRQTVRSSITAEGFYTRLGFVAVRDQYVGAERTIIMERSLIAADAAVPPVS